MSLSVHLVDQRGGGQEKILSLLMARGQFGWGNYTIKSSDVGATSAGQG